LKEIGVDDLPQAFKSLAHEAMRDHEKRFQDRIKAVKDASNSLDGAASRFEAAVHNAWGTMDKSASEYGTRLAQTLEELARRLSRQQISASYDDTERFHEDSVDALNKIIKAVRKYVPKLRRGLRVEMANLNVSLSKLETAVRSLGLALDQSPGSKIETVRRQILQLTQVHADLRKLRAEESEATRSLQDHVAKERAILARGEELASEGMFLELTHYEDSLRAKGDEIRMFLQPIVKPLSKLERTVSESKNQPVNLGMLHDLIERPVETVATGQAFALVQLFNQLGAALTTGGLEIEERRRRKAEEIIQQVKEGALESLRGDYLTIQANVQETMRQLKAKGLLDKKRDVDQALAAVQNDKAQLTSQITELHRSIETATKTMAKERASIEEQITQLTGQPLQIRTE